jgi:hypothetical protein
MMLITWLPGIPTDNENGFKRNLNQEIMQPWMKIESKLNLSNQYLINFNN